MWCAVMGQHWTSGPCARMTRHKLRGEVFVFSPMVHMNNMWMTRPLRLRKVVQPASQNEYTYTSPVDPASSPGNPSFQSPALGHPKRGPGGAKVKDPRGMPGTTNVRCSDIWWFPEIGVPLHHPFLDGIFHYKACGIPHLWKPPHEDLFDQMVNEIDSMVN